MKAHGQLQHHFWGTYAATVVLQFESATEATIAREHVFPAWHTHKAHDNVIVFHGPDEKLKAEIATLEAFGADRDKIESVAKSIDFGEPFSVEIAGFERTLLEACGQQPLFEA